EFFFFCTAHQFGFWHHAGDRYAAPMTAVLAGKVRKGSDFIVACATRAWNRNPQIFTREGLQAAGEAGWAAIFADDTGANPLPMWEEHLAILRRYAAWLRAAAVLPAGIVASANAAPASLAAFLESVAVVPGYDEDPLRKKLHLLAIILENRPEHFLRVNDPSHHRPIIDYHLQRSALRTGLVEVDDPTLRAALEDRRVVPAGVEHEIRAAVYEAVAQIVRQSGASVATVDYFFFTNRTRCPEMREPDCPACPVRDFCARRTRLFQPVFRTTAY
ncbi:MAG: aminopeptidase, partial [Verrucomicrobia bacterium]|nr:aminopeptidase [Verrucomicrobiota bacterium]